MILAASRIAAIGPIARLAWPTTLVMCSQIAANTFDAFMAGKIGTAALGGFAFVFPFVILMQTLAPGGIGGDSRSRDRMQVTHRRAQSGTGMKTRMHGAQRTFGFANFRQPL